MATQANLDYVQKMFVAYLGRASSESAQEYYADLIDADAELGKAQLFDDLFNSTEAQALYSGKTNDEIIEMIFQNCFNRDPSTTGTDYYTGEIEDGTFNILEAAAVIADSADEDGAAILAAKQTAADKITAEMGDDAAVVADYAANSTAARESLNSVTDAASAAAYDGAAELASITGTSTETEGTSFTLTTGADVFEGTAGSDTFTATNLTLLSGDILSDTSSDDNDTMNLTVTAAPASAAKVSGVENINVTIDEFAGAFNAFDANNTTGATITVGSSKLGYDGDAQIVNVKTNNVTAGANVDDLTVTGLTTGTVDTGSASVAAVTGSATKASNVTVNGDVELTMATTTELELNSTTATTVTLAHDALTDVTVTGDATIAATGADLDGLTVTGAVAVELTDGVSADVSDIDADVTVSADSGAADTITVASGQVITLTADQTDLTVAGSAATADVVVATGEDQTSLTISTADSATVNLTDEVTLTTLDVGAIDTTVNVDADTTITTLTATGDVVVAGSGDVTVTNATAASVDASGLTGSITFESSAEATLKGGSGDDDITVSDNDTSVEGGAGDDTVDATATTGSVIAFVGGAGTNKLKLDAPTTTLVYDGALGTDTIELNDGADLTGATPTLVSVENITVLETDGADSTANIDASMLSGESFTITGKNADAEEDVDEDGLDLTVTVDQAAVDLGSLTLSNVKTVAIDASGLGKSATITGTSTDDTIDGSTKADTIVDGAGDDTIDAGTGADVVTVGAGDDEIIVNATDSTAAAMDSITGFQAAAAAGDNDTLTVSGSVVAGTDTDGVLQVVDDVEAADALTGHTADADGELAANDINIVVTDGIVTLSGLAEDVAVIDTLAEWIDIAELALADSQGQGYDATTADGVFVNAVAFEFGGDTYVVTATDTEATTTVATESVIKLAGITGIDAIDTAAAADTILIA